MNAHDMSTIHVGVIAVLEEQRLHWVAHLRDQGATVFSGSLDRPDYLVYSVDAWVLDLPGSIRPQETVFWLRRMTARTLLLTPHVKAGLFAAKNIPHPSYVADPNHAQTHLRTMLRFLCWATTGRGALAHRSMNRRELEAAHVA